MGWRSVVVTQPSRLKVQQGALVVEQDDGSVRVPLEDISVLLVENPQIILTAKVLSACAAQQIALITVGDNHHPNGVLLSHLPHSRALKVMRAQLNLNQPARKQLWQQIIKRKIRSQSSVLQLRGHHVLASRLAELSNNVRSGDTGHAEAQASQVYFPTLFGSSFSRQQDRFYNAALNYGYSIIRAALARTLVSYGFLSAFGIHHRSEQNSFNLADDLIEPFRPLLDAYVLEHFPGEPSDLSPESKACLIGFLHEDVVLVEAGRIRGSSTVLAAIEAVVISLSQRLEDTGKQLTLPLLRTG